jgi:uncharacterized membrane protein YqaE (UPF0057 family)
MCGKILLCIIAIFFPPLAVFLETGCGFELLLNVILTILGWLPGVLHALFIIFYQKKQEVVVVTSQAPATITTTTTSTV